MRLRNIKLSGFKSFVDSTTLVIPANLVGIVGPNGCGKSNIIDAVMWVMGESSAKHLRGDALTDVIFNGSSARNPVGQASVELIFDNTENKLGGQYASYDEISIKRQINRDAISSYFLNGTRCRRRDIQAIFLGTGLGPRSYAIIEQGMISRLIEAKPEELRNFIEEAAGISKYRERRRETENRIRNTKDNITRLNDIREELDKQLKHLQRQANAAERYQVLKQEQRQLEAETQALQWKALKQKSEKEEDEARLHENRVESAIAELRQIENTIVTERESLSAANEHFNEAQSGFYRIGGDISQLEQKIHHINERMADTEEQLARIKRETAAATEELKQDETRLAELMSTKAGLEPLLQGSRVESDKAYAFLNDSEHAMQAWQTEWESFNTTAGEYARRCEIGKTRLEHLELGIEDIEQRQSSLQHELETIDRDTLLKSIDSKSAELKSAEAGYNKLCSDFDAKRQLVQDCRKTSQQLNERLNEQRLNYQKQEGRLASLEALQQSALGEDQEHVQDWLKKNRLDKASKLAQQINVDEEWAHAVEVVLERFLQDICVEDISKLTGKLSQLENGNLGIIDTGTPVNADIHSRFPALADKVNSEFPLKHLLAHIYVVNNLDAALAMRPNLTGTESVITPDGLWLGINWSHISRGQAGQAGMLTREKEIKTLKEAMTQSRLALSELEKKTEQAHTALERSEQQLNEVQTSVNKQQEISSDLRAGLAAVQAQLEQTDLRSERIQEELENLREELENDRNEIAAVRTDFEQSEAHHQELEKQRADLIAQRDKYRESLTLARERWQATHEESHGIALQLESVSSQRASLEQSIKRTQMQISHHESRHAELEKSLTENQAPIQPMKLELENKLKEKVNAEKLLGEARSQVQQIENALREREQSRVQHENQIQELRDNLEKARLVNQESRVRLQTIEEKLGESGLKAEEILATLNAETDLSVWRERLEQIGQKINRLGPINLAAIDEFSQLSERKNYLDKQDADLREALTTLENAIRKIDKESRSRFKETFDQLNSNLQETFPQLFGGGHAYLELTGDDLLETGVTIMARPPGKRNSTIHLLSGGEKALTAVALVFSIFKLNPAPFCILDEVDAPLDDANVGRFSELVSAMSEEVQFIFITHNKITMEIAHQLLGVTMHEAGVSRLVTVDVDEAVKMAATA
jgi:chromosome segregation protein